MPEPSSHAFSEKVALIADGTTPIGKAVALQLALYGAYVIVAHPADDSGLGLMDELKSLGTLAGTAPYTQGGIIGAAEIAAGVKGLFGRLDYLVNCAELKEFKGFDQTTAKHFSNSVEKVLESAFFNTKECTELMQERPKPKIVNIFSACDSNLMASDLAVSSVNYAIEGFTKSLADTLPDHFRVNGIRVSESSNSGKPSEKLDPELFRPKPAVDPDDVARTVLFLLSSEAGGLNGQILNVGA